MKRDKSAGHLTRVFWEGADLQIQTEVRYGTPSTLNTILVANGIVIARVEKPWRGGDVSVEDRKSIRTYHESLTRALERLHSKQWVKIEDLPKLTERMVSAALKTAQPTPTESVLAAGGIHWVAVADPSGMISEAAPSAEPAEQWSEHLPAIVTLLNTMSDVFSLGPSRDVRMRTEAGSVVIAVGEMDIAIAATDSSAVSAAAKELRNLLDRSQPR